MCLSSKDNGEDSCAGWRISSEYRYKNPVVSKGTLAIAISQSGETADTLAAMWEIKAKGVKILAQLNVFGSTITQELCDPVFTRGNGNRSVLN